MELKIGPEYVDVHQQVMKQIEADPEHWSQDTYVSSEMLMKLYHETLDSKLVRSKTVDLNQCGTTACYAGWTLFLNGYQISMFNEVFTEAGEKVKGTPFSVASELLGLNGDQAEQIFYYINEDDGTRKVTLEDLKARVSQVTGITFD